MKPRTLILQHHSLGDLFNERVASLLTGAGQRCQHTPSGCPCEGFVATGEFATNDSRAQLSLGEIVCSVHIGIVQKPTFRTLKCHTQVLTLEPLNNSLFKA